MKIETFAQGGTEWMLSRLGRPSCSRYDQILTPKTLKPATLQTLIQVARDIYPHDQLGIAPYAKVVEPYDAAAAKDEKLKEMLEAGVVDLDARTQAEHYVPYVKIGTRAEREALLRTVETGDFFQKIRGDLISGLYNNKAIWAKLGYEGESVSKGGYSIFNL